MTEGLVFMNYNEILRLYKVMNVKGGVVMNKKRFLAVILFIGMVLQSVPSMVYADEGFSEELSLVQEADIGESLIGETDSINNSITNDKDIHFQEVDTDDIKDNEGKNLVFEWLMEEKNDESCEIVGEDEELVGATYNIDNAVSYARSNCTGNQVQCDTFVKRCLNAGGLDTSSAGGYVTGVYNWLIKNGFEDYLISSKDNKYVYTDGSNNGKISVGDVIVFEGVNTYSHVGIVTGIRGNIVQICHQNFDASYRKDFELIGWYKKIVNGVEWTVRNGNIKLHCLHYTGNTDSEAPRISDVRVENVTSDGYDISCVATDNVGVSKVCFPTWTVYTPPGATTNQDDLHNPWDVIDVGTYSNGRWVYHVNRSEHKNEYGEYVTDIYAYDSANNRQGWGRASVTLKANVPAPSILDLNDRSVRIQTSSVSTWISIDGGGFTQYSASKDYILDTEGAHTIRAYSQDASGNKSTEVTRTFSIGKSETPGRVIEETPTASLITLTKSNSNSVIWYSINGGGYQKYTSQIRRSENSTIRYYSTRSGCVQSDVSEFNIKVTAPDKPNISLGNTTDKIGIGDVIMVKLNKQAKAGEYICILKIDGKSYKTVTSEDNNISIKAEEAGDYEITAIAKNNFGESKVSDSVKIKVMPDITVKFVDWDDSLLRESQKIKWGGSIPSEDIPKAPSREGYDFQGWDGSFTNLTEDTIIKAKYEIKVFTVIFRNADGALVKTERVEWSSSAHEPDMTEYIPAPGYIFAGWCVDKSSACEDFECVKGNMTLYASYVWENSNLSMAIGWMSVVCKKSNAGQYYDLIATLTCNPDIDSNARAILKLSTADGKTVAVKTYDIQLQAGETSKLLQFGINEDLDASKASLYIVGFKDQKTSGTLAKVVNADIKREVYYGEWSDWSETKPEADSIGTKKQYKWNTRETTERTNTRSLSGFRLVSTDTNVGGWSAWQDGAIAEVNNESLKREVQTQQVVTGTYYKYAHYCGRTNQGWETFPWSTSAFVSNAAYHEIGTFEVNDTRLNYMGVASDTGTQNWSYYPNGSLHRCSNTCYRWYRMGDPSYTYKTQYRYRDTTYVYHFEKVSDYGEWSDSKPTSYYQLQERTLYRGRNEIEWAALDEKNDTEKIHIEGRLENADDVSDKIATVFVYKETNTDPLQSQIEYLEEIKIGADNSYNLDILPRENLSAETGDFIVAFAIEGATRLINAKILQAPKALYTVNFIADGNVISTQQIEAGNSAQAPQAPQVDGRRFVRWNTSTANIKEDLDIEAIYQDASYAVVYVDKLNGTVDLVRAVYNDPISKEFPEAPNGYVCKGWDAKTVSGDMIVNAVYEKKIYTVTFMDASGENVVEKKTCSYGGSVLPPSYEYMTAGEGQRIVGWSMENDWRNVIYDMIVYPIVEYEKTAEKPYTTLSTMNPSYYKYKDEDIEPEYPVLNLLCDSKNAKIYYTTDGCDPIIYEEAINGQISANNEPDYINNTFLYSEPIKIMSDVCVKAISVEDGKNASDIAIFPIKVEEISRSISGMTDDNNTDESFVEIEETDISEDEKKDPIDSDSDKPGKKSDDKDSTYDEVISSSEKARNLGKGSVDDTDALVSYGNLYALSISGNKASVTVVKGNKFSLDGTKGSFKLKDSSQKKMVSVSTKGVVKAKKGTEGGYVGISFMKDNVPCELMVRVIVPSISSNTIPIKKMTANVNIGQAIDLVLDVPLNALYDKINTKNDGVISDLAISFCSDERYHITGMAVKAGKVSIPIYVNGKKFIVKVNVK